MSKLKNSFKVITFHDEHHVENDNYIEDPKTLYTLEQAKIFTNNLLFTMQYYKVSIVDLEKDKVVAEYYSKDFDRNKYLKQEL